MSTVYVPKVVAPAGVSVTVSPKILIVRGGGKATYRVTFTRTTAAFDEYAFGSPTWTGLTKVRSQLVVRPVAAAAPEQVTGTGTSGSAAVSVTPGFTGTLSTAVDGLVAADVRRPALQPSGPGFDADNPAVSPRAAKETVTIPAGATVAQHSTFDDDFPAGTDVDLYEAGTSNLVASSGGGSAEETIRIEDPPAGTYDLFVVLFGAAPGTTSQVVPTYLWNLDGAAKGNLTVTPASTAATPGTPVRLLERPELRHPLPGPDLVRRRDDDRGRHVRPGRHHVVVR